MDNQNSITNLQKAFSLFCTDNDMFNRAVMKAPFVVNDKTYATNGYVLIRCDNNEIDFKVENYEDLPKVEEIIPEQNMSQVIDLDSVDWNSLMTQDELIPQGEDIECRYCKGNATIETSIPYNGEIYHHSYDCPICKGSGLEQEQQLVPSGNKTFSYFDLVEFKDVHFFMNNFYKLKQVKDLLNANVEFVSYNISHKAIMFRIGIVEILIMPCYKGIDNYVKLRIP